MVYTRPAHGDPFADSSATDATVIIDALADGLEAAESTISSHTSSIALKANIAGPTFTGVPAAPTAAPGTNTTQLATTAFVTTADALKADLASPVFTGNPTAPTPATGDNDTSIATTAFATERATVGNLLTANQASIETDLTGIYVTTSATHARVSGGVHGTYCVEVTSGASGYPGVQFNTNAATSGTIPCVAGQAYTVTSKIRSAAVTRAARLYVRFWQSNGTTQVGATLSSNQLPAISTSWQTMVWTGVAPALAAFVSIQSVLDYGGSIPGEVHQQDGFGFWQGTGGEWQLPGIPITGTTPVGVVISAGAGSPEGVVVASIGALYLRSDGSTSTTLYVKTSGTSNTGWTAK